MAIPAKVAKRLSTSVPKFKKLLLQAKERDINEFDTMIIVIDMLDEIFGYDKFSEITREYAIQGTFCDLAIKIGRKVKYLIEVKPVGIPLKPKHIRQAVNYAAKGGIQWVVLTNGIIWKVYRVVLTDRVESEELMEYDFANINIKKKEEKDKLFVLCKRGVKKDLVSEYYEYRQSVNKYTVSATLLSEPVISRIRAQLRKIKPGMKVSNDEIEEIVREQVIKREITDSTEMSEANKKLRRVNRTPRVRKAKKDAADKQASNATDIPPQETAEETVDTSEDN